MNRCLDQLNPQKSPRRLSVFRTLNKNGKIYILDASAVLNDPSIESYSERYTKNEETALYVLTTALLREMDDNKHKHKKGTEHSQFMQKLRAYQAKDPLSKGQSINEKDSILYYRNDLKIFCESWLSWLSDEYTDKQLLCFAMSLKKQGKKVAIMSADSLLNILCHESGVEYIYVGGASLVSSSGLITSTSTQGLPIVNTNGTSKTLQEHKDNKEVPNDGILLKQ